MDYEKYELEAEKIRKENENYLKLFEIQLKLEGLAPKTIRKHVSNIDFYINEYLLYSSLIGMKDGMSEVEYFFSYWFVTKAMWSSGEYIKSNIASLKKFYKLMVDNGFAKLKDYEEMLYVIKESKDEWIYNCDKYNNYEDFDF